MFRYNYEAVQKYEKRFACSDIGSSLHLYLMLFISYLAFACNNLIVELYYFGSDLAQTDRQNNIVTTRLSMKKIKFLLFLGLLISQMTNAQIYQAKLKTVKFYSHTAMEDIDATDTTAIILLNAANNDVNVIINIKGFDFTNETMESHFNENYMETDKEGVKDAKGNVTYPNRKATLKGKINEKIDYTKDGTYNASLTGKLMIHGVEKERTINVTFVVKGGGVTVDSKFTITLEDHDIKIPSVMGAKIAENVEVTVHAVMTNVASKK